VPKGYPVNIPEQRCGDAIVTSVAISGGNANELGEVIGGSKKSFLFFLRASAAPWNWFGQRYGAAARRTLRLL
jgi:hypothetical protein